MAKKKKKQASGLVYLGGYIPEGYVPSITTKDIFQIPPYADKGVKYEGYSKKQLSENKYRLYIQIPYREKFTFSKAGIGTSNGFFFINPQGKNFFCSKIILSRSDYTATGSITINDSILPSSTRSLIKIYFDPADTGLTQEFDFNTPLFFTDGVHRTVDVTTATTLAGDITFFGWFEDKE